MLARLLLSLLLACLAFPAMAAPHCDPAPAMTRAHAAQGHEAMHHRQAPAPADSPSLHHDCIGCIAPIARAAYRPEQEPLYAALPVRPLTDTDGFARSSGAPETPPPRHLA